MAVEVKTKETNETETEQLATGCEAIAEAIRLADVDVMAAYPIRPYDGVMQAAAKLIANGKMDVEYIVADGEHSQFEIVKHACAGGARRRRGAQPVRDREARRRRRRARVRRLVGCRLVLRLRGDRGDRRPAST